jgi:hypothetical protein
MFVGICRAIITSLEALLASVKTRRNECFAHPDANSVGNPVGLTRTAPLSMADPQTIFDQTENILRKMGRFQSGLAAETFFLEQDDDQTVLKIIAEANCMLPGRQLSSRIASLDARRAFRSQSPKHALIIWPCQVLPRLRDLRSNAATGFATICGRSIRLRPQRM